MDKVFEECQYTSRGIVVQALDYLKEKKNQLKTTDLLPNIKFFNQLENQFINGAIRNRLSSVQFEKMKNEYLESADAKLLFFSLKNSKSTDKLFIVSEETEVANDNKAFKKLPAICKILQLEIITLPKLFEIWEGINFEIK